MLIDGLSLPPRTFVLAQRVDERVEDEHRPRLVIHILDAMMLGGMDIRRSSYTHRVDQARLFVKSLERHEHVAQGFGRNNANNQVCMRVIDVHPFNIEAMRKLLAIIATHQDTGPCLVNHPGRKHEKKDKFGGKFGGGGGGFNRGNKRNRSMSHHDRPSAHAGADRFGRDVAPLKRQRSTSMSGFTNPGAADQGPQRRGSEGATSAGAGGAPGHARRGSEGSQCVNPWEQKPAAVPRRDSVATIDDRRRRGSDCVNPWEEPAKKEPKAPAFAPFSEIAERSNENSSREHSGSGVGPPGTTAEVASWPVETPEVEPEPEPLASWPLAGLYFVPIKTRDYRRNSVSGAEKGALINYSFRACMSNRVFWQQEEHRKSSINEEQLLNIH